MRGCGSVTRFRTSLLWYVARRSVVPRRLRIIFLSLALHSSFICVLLQRQHHCGTQTRRQCFISRRSFYTKALIGVSFTIRLMLAASVLSSASLVRCNDRIP
ncbi:hypothetical protein HBI56_169990 [Parastagonospora nodorum]|uniref:Uncharacterized protein n=1 Tax=Phaeosphaeria nodorum (strain SN15 / ATCC MYA-4574 / FGSC 10173) TaxID=321614 RepID=A0A7U2FAY0_PHANO|nr:hypothetical protein HBH56_048760 [Parastagonospora nodorum]QRD01936.1 hypothetical protein JI435_303440 [Parastagonospora nodorum SN15]KAH3935510.1 hypothetical protein HBH54_034540 [Parastagonospora nodorum]KAH3942738.1 hypothetical protein HBH53_185410 [Parastagonospora nodorum]KAH3964150.1 hypothetical protein HBH51_160390 [Parastagonospora nodorum]